MIHFHAGQTECAGDFGRPPIRAFDLTDLKITSVVQLDAKNTTIDNKTTVNELGKLRVISIHVVLRRMCGITTYDLFRWRRFQNNVNLMKKIMKNIFSRSKTVGLIEHKMYK